MAELAFTPDIRQRRYHITAEDVARIEQETDRLSEEVPLPPQFVLPGDTVAGGVLDVARAVIRRAERVVVRLAHEGEFDNSKVLSYLNRLCSLLFILEIQKFWILAGGSCRRD